MVRLQPGDDAQKRIAQFTDEALINMNYGRAPCAQILELSDRSFETAGGEK